MDTMTSLEPILGYLNFSEGRPDPRFQKQLNEACAEFAERGSPVPWRDLRKALEDELATVRRDGKAAFRESARVEASLRLVFDEVVPAYRRPHADLLFHLEESDFH